MAIFLVPWKQEVLDFSERLFSFCLSVPASSLQATRAVSLCHKLQGGSSPVPLSC